MENEGNAAYLAKIYPKISKEGQDCLDNMAHTMLSIQNSGVSPIPGHKDKVQFVAHVYPQVSPQGQEYLERMANTMLAIQRAEDGGI